MLGGQHRKKIATKQADGPKFRVGWLLVAVLLLVGLAIPAVVLAQSAADQLAAGMNSAQSIGLGTTDVRTMIARIINYFFGLMGILAVALFIYGGYTYMTAKGDSAQIDKAKQIITSAVIGMVIILSAYAIAQFIIRAILGGFGGPGDGSGEGGGAIVAGYCQGCGPEHLGNGIITYHYPEPNQLDVPRNVSIAIKLKKPYLPSTVLKGEGDLAYNDNGTYDITDDRLCGPEELYENCDPIDPDNPPPFYLNTDNLKVLPTSELQEITGASDDEQFDSRYESTALLGNARAFLGQVAPEFDPNNLGQDLVIIPPVETPLGSSQEDVEYRVGLRGSDNGLKVWSWDPEAGEPKIENAFDQLNPDGSYFWNFTTGTLLDLTPPEVRAIIPISRSNPETEELYRNQLLQVYFSKPMNPITVSGINGTGGFSMIEVKYKDGAVWKPLNGTWVVASGYKAIEFTPEAPCDMVAENSCGDKVYCLPGSTNLAVIVLAADLSDSPPRAGLPFNGAVDMVSNSLDGNADGELEGQSSGLISLGSGDENSRLIPGTLVTTNFSRDSLYWFYFVGNDIDLTPPAVEVTDPPNTSYNSYVNPPQGGTPGSSEFPPDQPITSAWTKVMSISSMITGGEGYPRATITLRAEEPAYPSGSKSPGPPGYSVEPSLFNDNTKSLLTMKHRVFFTSNDLGWPPEIAKVDKSASVPVYVPVFKSRLKDSRQNCFFPSKAVNCANPETDDMPYCCDMSEGGEMPAACLPPPST